MIKAAQLINIKSTMSKMQEQQSCLDVEQHIVFVLYCTKTNTCTNITSSSFLICESQKHGTVLEKIIQIFLCHCGPKFRMRTNHVVKGLSSYCSWDIGNLKLNFTRPLLKFVLGSSSTILHPLLSSQLIPLKKHKAKTAGTDALMELHHVYICKSIIWSRFNLLLMTNTETCD